MGTIKKLIVLQDDHDQGQFDAAIQDASSGFCVRLVGEDRYRLSEKEFVPVFGKPGIVRVRMTYVNKNGEAGWTRYSTSHDIYVDANTMQEVELSEQDKAWGVVTPAMIPA